MVQLWINILNSDSNHVNYQPKFLSLLKNMRILLVQYTGTMCESHLEEVLTPITIEPATRCHMLKTEYKFDQTMQVFCEMESILHLQILKCNLESSTF